MFKETDNADDYEVFAPWFDASINEVDSFDLNIFLAKLSDKSFYHYYGSLTTIPCS